MNAKEMIQQLGLTPHPVEGGYYRRTWSSGLSLSTPAGPRLAATAIYYLLEPGTFSEMHRLRCDEVFHFYLGDPVEMLHLYPDGSSGHFILGPDLGAGQHVQLPVSAGIWQGCHLLPGGSFALLGCTVTPGFDFADYEGGSAEPLIAQWPWEAETIQALTRRS